jgi:hypothetical protein
MDLAEAWLKLAQEEAEKRTNGKLTQFPKAS